MIATLVECTDSETVYGILTVNEVSDEKVQQKIYEIKNRFYEQNKDDWTVEDVLNSFPDEWEWEYRTDFCTLEI